jgi:hypothetical protein
MISPPGGMRIRRLRQETNTYKFFTKLRVRNSDGIETKFSASGKRWYCGQRYTEPGNCKCGGCDGACGPNNGCPCESCSQLELNYCGKEFCLRGKCFCGTCDGRCGPTNGCPCIECILRSNLVPAINRFDHSRTVLYPPEDLFTTMVLATSKHSISVCSEGHRTFALKKIPPSYEAIGIAEGKVALAMCNECREPVVGRMAHCALCHYDICRACELAKFGALIKPRVMCSAKHPLITRFEKPQGYMGNTKCSACQQPIEYEDGFFHCPKCSYDLCQQCEQSIFTQLRGVWPDVFRCPCGGHTGDVSFTTGAAGDSQHLMCNQCEDSIRVSDGYMVAECCPQSAVCFNCCRQFVRKYLSDLKLSCQQLHMLKAFCSSKQGANLCDKCENHIVYKNGYLRCDPCDFDLCPACAHTAVEERTAQAIRDEEAHQSSSSSSGVPNVRSGRESDALDNTYAKPTQLLREYHTYLEEVMTRVPNIIGPIGGVGGGDAAAAALLSVEGELPVGSSLLPVDTQASLPAQSRSRTPPPPPLLEPFSDDDDAVRTVRQGKVPSTTRHGQQQCTVDNNSPGDFESPINKRDDGEEEVAPDVPLTLRIVYETEEWVVPAREVSSLDSLLAIVAQMISNFEGQPVEASSILLDVVESGECSPLHLPRRFNEAFSRLNQGNPVLRVIATLENCPIQGWSRLEQLGKGTFGTVFKAVDDTGFIFAAKEIELADVAQLMRESSGHSAHNTPESASKDDDHHQKGGGGGSGSSEALLTLQSEIRLVRQLKHTNLIEYFGSCEAEDNKFYILMEFVDGGSLAHLISSVKLTLTQVQSYAKQLLAGLSFLHRFSVVHRDVKPDNIMLTGTGTLKIVDFGTAKHLGATLSASTGMRGTPLYMAPEIIEAKGCRTSCDIWSVGCTIVQMITQKRPYSELGKLNAVQLMFRIATEKKGPNWPRDICDELNDMLEQCFRTDPEHRPSALQLLTHPFFAMKFDEVAAAKT